MQLRLQQRLKQKDGEVEGVGQVQGLPSEMQVRWQRPCGRGEGVVVVRGQLRAQAAA